MPRYLIDTLYQTPSGNPNGHRCTVTAKDEDEAMDKAVALCRRERRVMKIDGGDILQTYPDIVPVRDPDEKLPREVYRDVAARLGMRVGTYSESSATFEPFEDNPASFDPRRAISLPGWFVARLATLVKPCS